MGDTKSSLGDVQAMAQVAGFTPDKTPATAGTTRPSSSPLQLFSQTTPASALSFAAFRSPGAALLEI
jgi:hypothetical protein